MREVRIWRCVSGIDSPLDTSHEWLDMSVNEISSALPTGVYTTLRTYGKTRVLLLDQHFARLSESANLLGAPLDVSRIGNLRDKLRIANIATDFPESRIRIHIPLKSTEADAFLLFEKLTIPTAEEIQSGVSILTCPMHRSDPRAKSTSFIETAEKVRQTVPLGINEVLMIEPGGRCLEGLSSNFFAVSNGTIWTAGEGVLFGITRTLVLDILKRMDTPVVLEGLPASCIPTIEEAFITSTSRGVLPVSKIDSQTIGKGIPGSLTVSIRSLFEVEIQRLLEPL